MDKIWEDGIWEDRIWEVTYHAGTSGLAGNLLRHEPVYERRENHQADEESGPLQAYCCQGYGERVDAGGRSRRG